MRELRFTKEHTQIAKGIAILLMLAHHLFAFPDRIHVDLGYISILSIRGHNIEYLIGIFGKLCVSMYLFLSGYGIYIIIQNKGIFTFKESFKRVKSIYINYWIVFTIFIPIGFIFFNKNFNIIEFMSNFIGISSSYNGEWWFFRLYIELILLLPILKFIVNENLFKSLVNVVGLLLLSKILNKALNILPYNIDQITNTIIYRDIIILLNWQAVFLGGYICAKFDIYSKVIKQFIKMKIDNKLIYILLCILVGVIRQIRSSILIDAILAPIFIFAVVNILYNSIFHKMFVLLGKHSTNMWLTHSFFCYTYFQWLVFKPRVSILVLIWLVVLSLFASLCINYFNSLILYFQQLVKQYF